MKLFNRFLIIYLLVTVLVLTAGGIISYHIIKDEINFELKWRFLDRINRVSYLLEKGKGFQPDSVKRDHKRRDRDNLVVRKLDYEIEPHIEVGDTMAWHPGLQRMEPNLKVAAYREINGEYYYIATYGVLIESDDIAESVIKTLLWILGLQIVGAIGVGYFVSGNLFKPFRKTLNRIKNFKLQKREPIEAEKTKVREFNELNRFVEEMTSKAVADYRNLKEFAENASHELQTPLSIVKGKLELLLEDDLKAEQYQYVQSAQNAISKLSKLSESLGLLTKIENQEFDTSKEVDLTHLVQENINSFEELIVLNDLTVKCNLQDNVVVDIHPALADIMWTNLLQNAIKHNIEKGSIKIELDDQHLSIANTGKSIDAEPEDLFKRFKKADQSTNSIGLGLSIVKQIVEKSGFDIAYTFENGMHTITIYLSGD